MLVELSIRDLVLFERLELELGPGLNALTGETGAGKSLFVGALELLRGELPRGGAAQWVRKGAAKALVEGRFVLDDARALEEVRACLAAELPAIAEEWSGAAGEAELILGRSLSSDGRTRAHVNQRPVALKALRALASVLIEIHGQNDHQRLLSPAEQLRLFDAHGGLDAPLERYRELRGRWLQLAERLARLTAEQGERRDRIDLLRFQREELAAAGLAAGEHAALAEEREILRGAGELRIELGRAVEELVEGEGAALDRVRAAVRSLERWRERIARVRAPLEELHGAGAHLEEAAVALTSLSDEVTDDPARLEAVEERLAELERLERKYHADEAGLLGLQEDIARQLTEIEGSEESLESLGAELARAGGEVEAAAAALSRKRRALAPKLARKVESTLAALGLERARFAVELRPRPGGEPRERLGPRGADEIELMLAANPGEECLPLKSVVSGGEAARIMLALRTVLRSGGGGRVLVFDEIDAGVGGRLGPAVGAHLRGLAERDQVLCVTHIPAIAALAQVHLATSKEVRAGRTRTSVAPIAGEARVTEIADMIAGGAAHSSARAEARRLLKQVAPRGTGGR